MKIRLLLLSCLLVFLLAAPALLPSYQITLMNYIGLSSIVVLGIVLLTGIGGLTSFGQAAFVGIGAYTTALLTTSFGLSPWVSLLASLAFTGLVAFLLGLITLGLSGHYLPVCTLAWSLCLYFLAGNLSVLGAHDGITAVPPVAIGQVVLQEPRQVYYLIWLFALLSLWSVHNLLTSHSGRAIRCLRRHSTMIESFGVDTRQLKNLIFIYAAVLAGLSGWLYAHLVLFVNPTPFGLNYSIEYLFMAVVGGAATLWGSVVGAAALTILRDRLQDILPRLFGAGGAVELLVFGTLMVLVLHRARTGIVPFVARLLPPVEEPGVTNDGVGLPQSKRSDSPGKFLVIDRVSRRFGGLTAVNAVSFELNKGEVLGLIGPNGAGKTTLFNLITGALKVSDGAIFFKGQRIDLLPAYRIAPLGIARTFQHVHLQSDMSTIDNVAIGAHLRRTKGVIQALLRLDREEERKIRVEAWRNLKRVGLDAHAYQPAGELALGQQRILEIARALTANPELLLLDEPAAGLRHHEKMALAEILRALRSEGVTILIVEHDMEFVMNLVDRIVVVDFGQKIAEGPPAEIQRNATVQKAYLGVAA